MASSPKTSKSTNEKVRRHRARLRGQGLRPLQVWVPDTRTPGFEEEARRQSLAVAANTHAEADQRFVDAISDTDFA